MYSVQILRNDLQLIKLWLNQNYMFEPADYTLSYMDNSAVQLVFKNPEHYSLYCSRWTRKQPT